MNNDITIPVPTYFGDPEKLGIGVQRTMSLLAGSTAEKKNTVKILYYGQSGMETGWCEMLTEMLRLRFPHANLITENRALGGFSSQRLVHTTETDLYPFYPDLMIFSVLGADGDYEDIIRRTRERTTAEILIISDYVRRPDQMEGDIDPAEIVRGVTDWNIYFDSKFLPETAKKYSCGFADICHKWRRYLLDTGMDMTDLLANDKSHLGPLGNQLLTMLVDNYLTYRGDLADDDNQVLTYTVGEEISWQNGILSLDFTGNRVDAVVKPGNAIPAPIKIDGTAPSEIPELYRFTRALATPGAKWPVVLKITSLAILLLEEWSMTVTTDRDDDKLYHFTVSGSHTGFDGNGSSDRLFVSNSGRVVIEPADWDVIYALGLPRIPVPEKFIVNWHVVPYFTDNFVSPGVKNDGIETTVTLAQGLNNEQHKLEISGSPDTPVSAIRIYRPKICN